MADTLKSKIERFEVNEGYFNNVITGSASSSVTIGGDAGAVKTLAKVIGEIAPGNDQGAWTTSTAYVINDIVLESGAYYRCRENHTAGTFATDLAAGKWRLNQGGDSTILTHRGRSLDVVIKASFPTVSAAAANADIEDGDYIRTYANSAYNIEQTWKVVSSATPDAIIYIQCTGTAFYLENVRAVNDGFLYYEEGQIAEFGAAITALQATGYPIKINPGTYTQTTGAIISGNFHLISDWVYSRNATSYAPVTIDQTGLGGTVDAITATGPSVENGTFAIRGIRFNRTGAASNTGDQFKFTNYGQIRFEHVYSQGGPRHCLNFVSGNNSLYTDHCSFLLENKTGDCIHVDEITGNQTLKSWFDYDTDMGGGLRGLYWNWPSGGGSTIGLIRSRGLKSVLCGEEAVYLVGKGDCIFYDITGENSRSTDVTKPDIFFGGCRYLKVYGLWASGDAGAATTTGSLVIDGCKDSQFFGAHVDNTTGVVGGTVPYSMQINGGLNLSFHGYDVINGDGRGLEINTTASAYSLSNNPTNIKFFGTSIEASSDTLAISSASNAELGFFNMTLNTAASWVIGAGNLNSTYRAVGTIYKGGGSNGFAEQIGGVKISNTNEISGFYKFSQLWNAGSIGAGATATASVTATGLTTGDPVAVTHNGIGAQTILITAHVRAADIVDVIMYNPTGGALTVNGNVYVTGVKAA